VLVVGQNGVGKTNLLESLHVAVQGFSPRTRQDAQLIRFGAAAARTTASGVRRGAAVEAAVTVRVGRPREATLNGARLPSPESLRRELTALVFTPDRLTVVKGGPAARRAYLDRVIGRLQPARAALPQEYLAALTQRNAGLRRVQLRLSDPASLEPWTAQVAELGRELVAARTAVLAQLGPAAAEHAEALGLRGLTLAYAGEPPTAEQLDARLSRDVDRGSTSLGPHLDEISLSASGRDLRQFGSQGEQRLTVLALLLAEAELLSPPPLLLLDDVLSELDGGRRGVLADRLAQLGQTMITATSARALPADPAQVVEVEHGSAR
jgi:DNA replication and repair protein RecF